MASTKSSPPKDSHNAIRMHANDNVLIVCQDIESGQLVVAEHVSFVALDVVPVGHKIASEAVRIGDKFIRYGTSVGSATQNVRIGNHVHLHNMQSDYIPTHSRNEVE